jgi:2-oxoglutarate dehydrogenase E2 component (dihydrolipoamide succinyltransferase)
MAIDIKSPQFPESIFEGTLSTWLKKEGQEIKQDEVLAEIETDKVVIEVTAPSDGVMGKIIIDEGATIKSSEIIGTYDDVKGTKPSEVVEEVEVKEEPKIEEVPSPSPTPAPIEEQVKKPASEIKKISSENKKDLKGFRMGPAAKKLLNEKDVAVEDIHTSTKKGVITKQDILNAESKAESKAKAESADTNKSNVVTESTISSKRVPMTRLRSVVAKRLLESQSQTASLTTFNEVDLFEVKELRAKYKETFEEKFGVKLGFMGMFLKASSIALQEMPIVNASIDGDDIVYHGFQDIGVAVSTDRGLVVPVVRDVQNLSIAEIELAIRDYSIKARDGKLGIEDITGGTFTISNGGVFGSLLSTPILNPPQSAILGMHKIQDRPMVVNGNIEIRPVMYLALTYDHRLLDGKDAVSFLVKIKEILESPESMILGV